VLARRSFSEVGKSWTHSGFNVFVGDPIQPSDKKRILFAARYLKKCPLSNQRLTLLESTGVTIIEFASFKDGVKNIRSFEPLEFLAELQQHIPDAWEQTSRFLGVYSSRTRGKKTTQYDAPAIQPLPEPIPRPSASWARCMKKYSSSIPYSAHAAAEP
jgi:Putative transposase